MADERDAIRSRISIVELVGRRVNLKRTGKHWKGLCPFHEDRNPSFTVSDSTGTYRCWACGEHGDIFTWVMKTQSADFREALEHLAKEAGVELKPRGQGSSPSQRARQLETMQRAAAFFSLELERSSVAKSYLESRGIDDGTKRAWEIGFAPDVDAALASQLQRSGVALTEASELFLVERDASGSFRDKFRGRLIFPIRDERGDLVAFGGRLLGEGHPKYINSGDTPLFHKSRLLYGLHVAKDPIAKSRRAVLVEGYLDVIACHRAGLNTAVASLGTSLTEDHAKLLKRFADEVVVFYDADAAGQKAAERAIEILEAAGLKASVAMMPEGKDPDTLLRDRGPAAVAESAAAGLSPLEFRILCIESRLKPEQPEFWPEIVEALARSSNLAEWERVATSLAAKHMPGSSPQNARATLLNEVRRVRQRSKSPARARRTEAPLARAKPFDYATAEAAVLRGILEEPTRAKAWQAIFEDELWVTPLAVDTIRSLRETFRDGPPTGAPSAWLPNLDSEAIRLSLADVELRETLQMSDEFLEGSLQTLRRDRDARRLAEVKVSTLGEERLREVQRRLQELKAT